MTGDGMKYVRIESITALFAFMERHGGVAAAEINGRDGAGFTSDDEGVTEVRVSDGSRLRFKSDYESDYSEYTAGQGFTLTVTGYEPNEVDDA
jgi:hypothetical protein